VDIDIGIRAVDNTLINKPDLAKALNDNYAGAFVIEENNPLHLHAHFQDCS